MLVHPRGRPDSSFHLRVRARDTCAPRASGDAGAPTHNLAECRSLFPNLRPVWVQGTLSTDMATFGHGPDRTWRYTLVATRVYTGGPPRQECDGDGDSTLVATRVHFGAPLRLPEYPPAIRHPHTTASRQQQQRQRQPQHARAFSGDIHGDPRDRCGGEPGGGTKWRVEGCSSRSSGPCVRAHLISLPRGGGVAPPHQRPPSPTYGHRRPAGWGMAGGGSAAGMATGAWRGRTAFRKGSVAGRDRARFRVAAPLAADPLAQPSSTQQAAACRSSMGRGSAWMRPYRRGDLRCAAMIWGDRSLHSPDALCSNCDFADSGGANPIFPRRLRRRAQSYLRAICI